MKKLYAAIREPNARQLFSTKDAAIAWAKKQLIHEDGTMYVVEVVTAFTTTLEITEVKP